MPCQVSGKKRVSTAGSCSSAIKIGGNDDLLIEILVLLPAKSVVRFKSVCKQWLSLISGEFFTYIHFENCGRRYPETQHSFILTDLYGIQIFLCHPTMKKLTRVSLPRPIRHQPWEHVKKMKVVKVFQSMNGLLLLSLKFYRGDGIESIDYVVFNPTTKQYRFIDLDGYRPIKICLLFDPSKSKYYKLVMTTSAIPRFSVYDSTTHKWPHGKDSPEFSSSISDGAGLTLCSLILDYATHTSVCRNLYRPPESTEYENYVFESNERFNMIQLKKPVEEIINKRCIRVGIMVDDKWVIRKEATLDFGNNTIGLLGMIREQSIEDSAFLFHVPGQLLIYRFSQDDLEVVVDYKSDYFYEEDQLQFQYAHPFIHTFAPV